MNIEEVFKEVSDAIVLIDNFEVYYPLRIWGLKIIRQETMDTMKYALILDYLNFRSTTPLISWLFGSEKGLSNINQIMSRLGDKNVLNNIGYGESLKDKSARTLTYEVNKAFLEMLRIDFSKFDYIKEMLKD